MSGDTMTLEQALALSDEVSPAPMRAAAALRVLAGHIRALTEHGAPGWDKTDAILALQRQTLKLLEGRGTAGGAKKPRKPQFEKKSDWAEHKANEAAARARSLEKEPIKIGDKRQRERVLLDIGAEEHKFRRMAEAYRKKGE